MQLEDFKLGERFSTGAGEWICVDVGQRFALAVRADSPCDCYQRGEACEEVVVFDRWDFGGCWEE